MTPVAPPAAALARLGLELVARAVVDGLLHGAHRSARPGFSQEFVEYRDYAPGDDLRFVDWNAYARSDRLLLKRFDGETNTRLLLLVDASASMGVGAAADAPSKLRYAAWLAAALAHLAARQHDAAGLLAFADEPGEFLAPKGGVAAQQALLHRLDALCAAGGTNWQAAFAHAARRMTKRGVLVAISDFYCHPADFGRALRGLGARGHELIAFHLLTPAERRPRLRFGRNTILRDAESGEAVEVDVRELTDAYPRRLAAHTAALRREAAAAGADYVLMDTASSPVQALARYLRFRARRP